MGKIKFTQICGIMMLLSILCACGFQLRGQLPRLDSLPNAWQIQGITEHSALYQEIARQLHQAGIRLVSSGGQRILMISEMRNTSRLLSVDTNNEAIESELTYSFQFALQDPSQDTPFEPNPIRSTRILYQPQSERLSSDREAIRLQEAMRRELVTRMVRTFAAKALAQ